MWSVGLDGRDLCCTVLDVVDLCSIFVRSFLPRKLSGLIMLKMVDLDIPSSALGKVEVVSGAETSRF